MPRRAGGPEELRITLHTYLRQNGSQSRRLKSTEAAGSISADEKEASWQAG